jgi:mannose-6-phosphate isomerase-like protein (cupin superfamily)
VAHGTEEFMLVLEGVMDTKAGPSRYVLEPGNAMHYPGVPPHRFFSAGNQDLIFAAPFLQRAMRGTQEDATIELA